MRNIIKLLLIPIISIYILFGSVCQAQDTSEIMKRIPKLMEFDSYVTMLPVPKGMPKIVFNTQEQLDKRYFGKNYNPDIKNWIKAETKGGVIFLNEDFNLKDEEYVLVHELVHYMQFENDKYHDYAGEEHQTPVCKSLMEPEAYRAQDAWVSATGKGKLSDPFTVMAIVAACSIE